MREADLLRQVGRTQRLGAYAVVVRTDDAGVRHLLLCTISERGYPAGWWALPGGQVEHGESPHETVARELYEETGLVVAHQRLVDIHSIHTVDTGRNDQYEDYHGVHVLYAVDITAEGLVRPRVTEVEGTTESAHWVPMSAAGDLEVGPRLPVIDHVLASLGDYDFSLGR